MKTFHWNLKILFIFSAIFAAIHLSNAQEENKAPDGFTWQILPSVNGAILKPKEWFFHHIDVPKEKRFMLIFSRENYQAGEKLNTSIKLIIICGIPEKKNISPSEYIEDFINQISSSTKIENRTRKERASFIEYTFSRVDKSKVSSGTIREYFLGLANNKSGTVYLFSFITPIERWDKDFPIAETIFNNLRLDDNL
ncbi:MAG TPA: hypothetical protein P5105_01065 [Victivallales bacterium]|nr:hypothetical protein [Victivallales bacterium]HPO90191.1 hypothetical protein [Victivallales bacterium]HRR05849.1 hypothetical protein [Victivallales bacterium]HRR28450.1 hypothetical protein [Victivallales bacterium]HRU00454.1 hypothetical protein [Victivallales bacterium]